MHYHVEGHAYVDCSRFREATGMEFLEYLEANCKKTGVARLVRDEKHGHTQPPATEVSRRDKERKRSPGGPLEVRKLKLKKGKK
jgi:hypothetical protein